MTTNLTSIEKQAAAACEGIPGVTYTVCPRWCTTPECMGEHHGEIRTGYRGDEEYLPATAGLPRAEHERGSYFPAVGVRLSWDTIDHLDPCVSVYITGPEDDCQIDLRPHEARALIAALNEAVGKLTA